MTIGKRLIALVAVPLVALLVLGIFARIRLSEIEDRSRFVAETQLGSVAALGSISASFAELRVSVRNILLAADQSERAAARAAFDENERALTTLLQQYADSFISDERDRQLLSQCQELSRQYIVEARQVMTLAEDGRHDEAADTLQEHCWTHRCHASPKCPASGFSTTRSWEAPLLEPPSRQSRKRGCKSWLPTWRLSCSRVSSAS